MDDPAVRIELEAADSVSAVKWNHLGNLVLAASWNNSVHVCKVSGGRFEEENQVLTTTAPKEALLCGTFDNVKTCCGTAVARTCE